MIRDQVFRLFRRPLDRARHVLLRGHDFPRDFDIIEKALINHCWILMGYLGSLLVVSSRTVRLIPEYDEPLLWLLVVYLSINFIVAVAPIPEDVFRRARFVRLFTHFSFSWAFLAASHARLEFYILALTWVAGAAVLAGRKVSLTLMAVTEGLFLLTSANAFGLAAPFEPTVHSSGILLRALGLPAVSLTVSALWRRRAEALQTLRNLRVLAEIAEALATTSNPDERQRALSTLVGKALPAEIASIFLVDPRDGSIRRRASSGDLPFAEEFRTGEALTGLMVQFFAAAIERGPSADRLPRLLNDREELQALGGAYRSAYAAWLPSSAINNYIAAPLIGENGRLFGILEAINRKSNLEEEMVSEKVNGFRETDRRWLAHLADLVAPALAHDRAEENRRALDEASRRLAGQLDPKEIMVATVDGLCAEGLGWEAAAVWLRDPAVGFTAGGPMESESYALKPRVPSASPDDLRILFDTIGQATSASRDGVVLEEMPPSSSVGREVGPEALTTLFPVFAVPLRAGPGTGGLAVFAGRGRRLLPYQLDSVRSFAHGVATSLGNALSYQETLRLAADLDALLEMSSRIAGSTNTMEISAQTAKALVGLSGGVYCGSMVHIKDAHGRLVATAWAGTEAPPKTPLAMGEGVAGTVAQSGQPLSSRDVQEDPGYVHRQFARANGLRGHLAVPIKVGSRTVGVLGVYSHEARVFRPAEFKLVQLLADKVAIAVRIGVGMKLASLAKVAAVVQGAPSERTALGNILHGLTAPDGLGFDRAVFLALDPVAQTFRGVVPVGHRTEAAFRVGRQYLLENSLTLEALLDGAVPPESGDDLEKSLDELTIPSTALTPGVMAAIAAGTVTVQPSGSSWSSSCSFCDVMGDPEECVWIPVLRGSTCYGLVYLDNRFDGRVLESESVGVLEAFRSFLSSTVERWRLVEQDRQELLRKMQGVVVKTVKTYLASIHLEAELIVKKLETTQRTEHEVPLEAAISIVATAGKANSFLIDCLQTGEPFAVSRTPVSVRDAIAHLAGPILRQARLQSPEVQFHLRGRREAMSATIALDLEKVERVFAHLLTNSLDAMPSAGKIYVRCAIERDSELLVCWEDTGGGIPKEVQQNIFDPFFSTKRKGRGLGLTTVLGLVEAHGGRIQPRNSERGARFDIRIPLSPKD